MSPTTAPPSPTDSSRCPYCLAEVDREASTAAGRRFCPRCCADWLTLTSDAPAPPPDAVVWPTGELPVLSSEEARPPALGEPTPWESPGDAALLARTVTLGADAPWHGADAAPEEVGEEERDAEPANVGGGWGRATMGLAFGLCVALAAAFVADHLLGEAPPAPSALAVMQPPARPETSAPALPPPPSRPPPAPENAKTEAPAQPSTPVEVAAPSAVDPNSAEAQPANAAAPALGTPVLGTPVLGTPVLAKGARDASAEVVEEAIRDVADGLPRASRVQVTARVEAGVAFLAGEVDSSATREAIAAAVAEVEGVRAVDSRAVKVVYRRHRVRAGETLSGLSQHYYGRSDAWRRIWEANQAIAPRPDAIIIGEVLLIPTEPIEP